MSSSSFVTFLNSIGQNPLHVLDASIPLSKYTSLDLSKNNAELNRIDVSSSLKLGNYINSHIKNNHARVAYGGYNEVRSIYNRSTHFKNKATQDARNIHLGMDLWLEANAAIYTPIEGEVHSFKNNDNFGDYGPAIILKHTLHNITFYTLYGHLSLGSLENICIGQRFKKGDKMASLGDSKINGDYPPHLHFQIIKDLQNYSGDYPGVCNTNDRAFYLENCPNPNLLLKIHF
ncbi:peptidoglycan DD-metalloendopeptidase family protein [Changchengzhania lutea]|uniref:peptidoglycan DD-metalloendopeptidase family protein n=1 Tax=Changchengzhania lutea TaxID=2049305 RepID=UPI00115ED67C|nr:peptidoglycan DD-metalloendopeptidase family protein [Changchengzhania lutea]